MTIQEKEKLFNKIMENAISDSFQKIDEYI